MLTFKIKGWEPGPEPTPTTVSQYWDKHLRLWVTQLRDEHGYQIGDTVYDSSKAGARISRAEMEAKIN